PIAEPFIQSVTQQVIEEIGQPIAAPVVPPAIESVAEPAAAFVAAIVPPVVQSAEEAVAETPQAAGEELPDSSAAGLFHATPHAIPPDNSAEIPPETPAAIFPEIFAQDTRNSPEIVEAPAEQVQAEAPLPPFPPRNERELFTRSPWISGQSLPEEKRSRKGLIAVIVICAIVAAAIASVPYAHSHRQQIGAAIISMGRSGAGQQAPNAIEQSPQTSQAAPQSSASSSAAPAASGAAIPINPPAVAAKPPGNSAPSASTVAPAPSGSHTPASEVHPNAPPAKSRSAAASATLPAATSPNVKTSAALAADTGQTEFRRAQQYLNGTGGVVADPVEAAEWFWRSLEKGNTGAAIPLSDLYLQGKGVSQSCLQARILLTTASHKGNAEAIQKLLQLPENCEQ
ncbi:MAG: hypothetical protein ACRD37_07895, partial [Candidatus Acidiferrales bacterium]